MPTVSHIPRQLEDVKRLIDLCHQVSAKHLYVLGDLCHAPEGLDLDTRALIREACQQLPERFLIEGNHDRRLRQVVESWGFAWLDEPSEVAGLTLRHHPGDGLYGHIHPTFRVKGPGEAIRLPCFVYDDDVCCCRRLRVFRADLFKHPMHTNRSS